MVGLLGGACRATVEGFAGLTNSDSRKDAYVEFASALIAYLVAIVIMAFVGKWLWNYAVVDLISVARPAKSIWQLVALMLLISLLLPAS